MGIALQKGGSTSLTKASPGLRSVAVGLGWDVRATTPPPPSTPTDEFDLLANSSLAFDRLEDQADAPTVALEAAEDGPPFDLDASLFLLTRLGRVRSDADFVFYNNLASPCGAVRHLGDNRTGEGEGDDELIEIDLDKVPAEIQRIRVVVTIHEPAARRQHFGMIQSAFMRVVNRESGVEVARFDLSANATNESSLIFGEIHRDGSEWRFQAIGEGYSGGLSGLARDAGVNVG